MFDRETFLRRIHNRFVHRSIMLISTIKIVWASNEGLYLMYPKNVPNWYVLFSWDHPNWNQNISSIFTVNSYQFWNKKLVVNVPSADLTTTLYQNLLILEGKNRKWFKQTTLYLNKTYQLCFELACFPWIKYYPQIRRPLHDWSTTQRSSTTRKQWLSGKCHECKKAH